MLIFQIHLCSEINGEEQRLKDERDFFDANFKADMTGMAIQ